MRIFFSCIFLLAFKAVSEVSVEKPNNVIKAAEQVKKAIAKDDISGVNVRLRVEGAEFSAFNLFFPDIKISLLASTPEHKNVAEIRKIIERDLAISGGFKLMTGSGIPTKNDNEALLKQKGAEGASYVSLSFRGPNIRAVLEHKNFMTGTSVKKDLQGNVNNLRRFSHELAQNIYENFIGPEDLFLKQIAAIKRHNGQNQVVLLDFDGHNETVISSGPWPKSSPSFSPDGKTIVYTVTSDQGQRIVEQEIGSKNIQERSKKAGLNLDARILPDNAFMLATLSLGKAETNIYKLSRSGDVLNKVNEASGRLNLSPCLSADGRMMAFVSDRSGSPQIFEQPFNTDPKVSAKRLTFQGRYNQTPQYSPDGKFIAFTGRDEEKVFDVFLLERSSDPLIKPRISRVTQNQGRNQEPFFLPSGRYLIFTSERDGKKNPDIYVATLNGTHQYALTNGGSYFSPVVRPGTHSGTDPQIPQINQVLKSKL